MPPALLATSLTPAQLLDQFRRFLPLRLIRSWIRSSNKEFYSRAFTPRITLWYLVFQRLSDKHTLSHVLTDVLSGGADRLSPRGKRLSKQLKSEATPSYNDARQRLPLEFCIKALQYIGTSITGVFKQSMEFGLKIAIIDGTTSRLRPLGDVSKHFTAHRSGNAKKPPYWCLMRSAAILCYSTGIILDSAVDSLKASEQALSALLLSARSWKGWLLVGDRNFGVYSVVRATVGAEAQGLFRLTASRAKRLAQAAGSTLTPGLDLLMDWSPTRNDQSAPGLVRTPVRGRLIAVRIGRRGHRPFTLYLFTTLVDQTYPVEKLVQIYAKRWNIELCLRYIKTQMEMDFLQSKSAEMARKEWVTGLIAYNLIRFTMAAAAAQAQVPLQLISFSKTRELLLKWLEQNPTLRPSIASWAQLLNRITKALLPKRRKPRKSEPRSIRPFKQSFRLLYGSRALARKKLAQNRC